MPQRSSWIILLALVAFIGVIYAASARILLGGFARVERDDAAGNVERLNNALQTAIAKVDAINITWAQWDAPWRYVLQHNTREDAAFAASDLSDGSIAQIDSNVLVYTGPRQNIVFGTGFDLAQGRKSPLPLSMRPHLKPDALLLRHASIKSVRRGLLLLPEGPLLVASRPLLTSEGRGPMHGALILGRFWDKEINHRLSEQLRLPVEVQRLDRSLTPDFVAARDALNAQSTESFVQLLDEQTIAGYLLLKDISGQPILIARVAAPRQIHQQGLASLRAMLLSLLAIGTISGLLLVVTRESLARSRRKQKEDEELYRLLTHNSSDVLYAVDLPSRRLTCYGDFAGLLGLDEAQSDDLPWLARMEPDDRARRDEKIRHACHSGEVFADEYRVRHQDGSQRFWLDRGRCVYDELGQITKFVGACTDITSRKKSEMEKEVLLKEIHHRVKNNMQVISSMLNLQSAHAPDRATVEMLRDSQNRIKSMALIHERLYRQHDLARVDFADYLRQLSGSLVRSYRTGSVELDLQLDPLWLDIDTAVPCGLIVNELVSNALKHAFRDKKQGRLSVALHHDGPRARLVVCDDGAGLPPGFNWREADSLGLQLVADFVDQIRGDIELATGCQTHDQTYDGANVAKGFEANGSASNSGTRWTITFASGVETAPTPILEAVTAA